MTYLNAPSEPAPPPPDALALGTRVVVTATSGWQGLGTIVDTSVGKHHPARMPCQVHGHWTPQGLFNSRPVPGCRGCNEQWLPALPFQYWVELDGHNRYGKPNGTAAYGPDAVRAATPEDEAAAVDGTLVPADPDWETRFLARRGATR